MNTKSVTRMVLRPLPVMGSAALLFMPLHAALIAQAAEQPAIATASSNEATPADDANADTGAADTNTGIIETSPAETEAKVIGAGEASYYGSELAGNRTANGERFNPRDYTAAHRTLPFGSRVQVTSVSTGKSVVVRINDRGPFHGGRLIDLSEAAAREIGLVARGSGQVRLALLSD